MGESLSDRRTLVVGASSGIGRATGEAAAGAEVAFCDVLRSSIRITDIRVVPPGV